MNDSDKELRVKTGNYSAVNNYLNSKYKGRPVVFYEGRAHLHQKNKNIGLDHILEKYFSEDDISIFDIRLARKRVEIKNENDLWQGGSQDSSSDEELELKPSVKISRIECGGNADSVKKIIEDVKSSSI